MQGLCVGSIRTPPPLFIACSCSKVKRRHIRYSSIIPPCPVNIYAGWGFWEFYLCSHQGGLPLTRTGRYFKILIIYEKKYFITWCKLRLEHILENEASVTKPPARVVSLYIIVIFSSPWDIINEGEGGGSGGNLDWKEQIPIYIFIKIWNNDKTAFAIERCQSIIKKLLLHGVLDFLIQNLFNFRLCFEDVCTMQTSSKGKKCTVTVQHSSSIKINFPCNLPRSNHSL